MVSNISLAGRLTRALILAVSAVWLVCMLAVGWYMHRKVNADLDSEMIESGRRMLDVAGHEYEERMEHGGPLMESKVVLPPLPNNPPVIFQLVNGRHEVMVRSEKAPLEGFPVGLEPGFSDTPLWRIYTVDHPQFPTFLHLASLHSERLRVLQDTILGLTLPMVAVLPLLAWLLSSIAQHTLRPVQQLASEIGQRGGANLRPVALLDMPAELHSVGEHVNHLLERLTQALQVERALASHAAHELRTPLATACLHLETALAQRQLTRPHVQASLDALKVLFHRTERLLQLSRAESATIENLTEINLVQLAAVVAQEFWDATATTAKLELVVPPLDLPAALGDLDGLAIALRNLVENALRHGGNSRVVIEVMAPSTLAVRDFGSGVAAARLQTLQQHHVRQVASQSGFGLGLSIVKTVVDKQQGQLELRSPLPGQARGFEARIILRHSRPRHDTTPVAAAT
jgi:two-component system, OmpR family, sensor kinase